MIKRLIDFYSKHGVESQLTMSELWKFITNKYHAKLHQALLDNNCDLVRTTLDNMAASDGLYGLDNPTTLSGAPLENLTNRLATSLGILPLPNPEQPFTSNPPPNIRETVEKRFGISLEIPECFGYCKSKGIVSKMLVYLAAWNSIESLRHPRIIPESILEIGGGIGLLGYLSWRKSVKRYTVIDLPLVAILNAYFASHYCPHDRIWLCGEPENNEAFARFYPSTQPDLPPDQKYDVAYNSDSLPEMTHDVQKQYISLLHKVLKPDGRFLSINHESSNSGQRRVYQACQENGQFVLIRRSPWHMRAGYVEEVWAPALIRA